VAVFVLEFMHAKLHLGFSGLVFARSRTIVGRNEVRVGRVPKGSHRAAYAQAKPVDATTRNLSRAHQKKCQERNRKLRSSCMRPARTAKPSVLRESAASGELRARCARARRVRLSCARVPSPHEHSKVSAGSPQKRSQARKWGRSTKSQPGTPQERVKHETLRASVARVHQKTSAGLAARSGVRVAIDLMLHTNYDLARCRSNQARYRVPTRAKRAYWRALPRCGPTCRGTSPARWDRGAKRRDRRRVVRRRVRERRRP
jgi:hypothetical protein